MNISTTPDTLSLQPKPTARPLVRTITPDGMTMQPEQTEEEKRLASSNISFQRQLTPEEENRVLFLKNMLAQLLTMANGQPTEEQRSRIKDIEKELEKITGVKMRSSLSDMTDKIPGKKDKGDEQEEKRQANGIDPKDAAHTPQVKTRKSTNLGMQMLNQRSLFTQLAGLIEPPS